jgi:hypothetical protein
MNLLTSCEHVIKGQAKLVIELFWLAVPLSASVAALKRECWYFLCQRLYL